LTLLISTRTVGNDAEVGRASLAFIAEGADVPASAGAHWRVFARADGDAIAVVVTIVAAAFAR